MKRVAITGLGLITPIGAGRQVFWERLLSGTSGIATVASFDSSVFPVHLGAEVKEFDPAKFVRRGKPEEMGRGSQLAIAAARMSIEDSGIELRAYDSGRVGVSMGTTSGERI